MKVSFLIASYNAQETLPKLVNKLLKQSGNIYPIELVISEDDGFAYKDILPNDKRIVYALTGLKTGPGEARSRALNKASGTHVCLLDSDDDVGNDYLRKIYTNLKKHNAFALKTVYKKEGVVVRSLDVKTLNFDKLSKFYGSIHTVAPKDWTVKYLNVVAEDVLATLNVLHMNNGQLPVVDAHYIINLHNDSYCAMNGAKFTNMYKECIDDSFKIAKELNNEKIGVSVKQMYQDRLDMSSLFDNEINNNPSADYHQFVINSQLPKDKINLTSFNRKPTC